jgi:hypothetical protein
MWQPAVNFRLTLHWMWLEFGNREGQRRTSGSVSSLNLCSQGYCPVSSHAHVHLIQSLVKRSQSGVKVVMTSSPEGPLYLGCTPLCHQLIGEVPYQLMT